MMTTKLLSCIIVGSSLLAAPALAQSSTKGQLITEQSSLEWFGSNVVGLTVNDPQNNKIGDIDQLLIDRNGNIEGVVIRLGGFLGMEKKDVAVPLKSLRWVSQEAADLHNSTTGSNTITTDSSSMATDATKDYPDHVVLNMTKDELKKAPIFHYASDNDKKSSK
jgi:hypothetical protein